MARPKKTGLDYFPFDVDFFSDKKIKRLRTSHGNDGVAVYIYLLCEIYRSGYYVEYDDDLTLDISDELNVTINAITQILNYLFSRSLLVMIESKLTVPVKVITAASVQRRYQAAKKGAKRDVDVAAEFWVLKENETESFIKVRPVDSNSRKNIDNSEKNAFNSEKKCTKESKVKKSKVKESKVEEMASPDGSAPSPSALDKLVYDYGQEAVDKYVLRVRSWYAEKGKSISDLEGTVRKWLEQDGVKPIDHSMDKYNVVINKF
jgi:hypothetical protein